MKSNLVSYRYTFDGVQLERLSTIKVLDIISNQKSCTYKLYTVFVDILKMLKGFVIFYSSVRSVQLHGSHIWISILFIIYVLQNLLKSD